MGLEFAQLLLHSFAELLTATLSAAAAATGRTRDLAAAERLHKVSPALAHQLTARASTHGFCRSESTQPQAACSARRAGMVSSRWSGGRMSWPGRAVSASKSMQQIWTFLPHNGPNHVGL